jgi:hypothetical protein
LDFAVGKRAADGVRTCFTQHRKPNPEIAGRPADLWNSDARIFVLWVVEQKHRQRDTRHDAHRDDHKQREDCRKILALGKTRENAIV